MRTHGRKCFFDDFLGAALRGEVAGTAENSGTAAVVVGKEGGAAEVTTGATSGNRAQLTMGLNFKPSSGSLVFRTRVKSVTAITARALFIGFTDTVSQENPIEIGALDAVTSNASDAVGFIYDTDAATAKWFVAGVKADVDTGLTAVKLNGVQQAPVADEEQEFVIEINTDGDAVLSFGRNLNEGVYGVREVARIENAVTPGTLLTPIVLIETRANAAKTAHVGYFDVDYGVA